MRNKRDRGAEASIPFMNYKEVDLMKKLKHKIYILLVVALLCGNFVSFAEGGSPRKAVNKFEYSCEFDIQLSDDFSKHPVYQYSNDGLLHVWAAGSASEKLFTFGDEKKITVQGAVRDPGYSLDLATTGMQGEYRFEGLWDSQVVWSNMTTTEEKVILLEDMQIEPVEPPVGDSDAPKLAIDMSEFRTHRLIRMYLYFHEDIELSGVITPCSKVVEYIPSSFKASYSVDKNGKQNPIYLFKKNDVWSTAPKGTWEADELEQKRNQLTGNLQDPEKPEETVKPTEKPQSTEKPEATEPPKRGINSGENVPKGYQGKTKEETIDQYSTYYDEDGVSHSCFVFTGTRGGMQHSVQVQERPKFTIYKNFPEISSDGQTTFEFYDVTQIMTMKEEENFRKENTELMMRVKGNLGEKLYTLMRHAWHIAPGTVLSGFEGLTSQNAYYGWREAYEITDRYIDFIDGQAGTLLIQFSDEERTGLKSFIFDIQERQYEIPYTQIDYTGPMLSYFLAGYMKEDWPEFAKSLGLNPDVE